MIGTTVEMLGKLTGSIYGIGRESVEEGEETSPKAMDLCGG